jgi:putative DNA primase/helicase
MKAEGSDNIPEPPPARGSSVGIGIGKTRTARKELVGPLTAEGLPVVVAVPRHKLGDEFVRDLVQDGASGRVYRGRSADDPDAPGEKMCPEHERTTAIFNALGDIGRNACGSGDGAHQCEFFNVCGYRKQMQAAPQTWVVPHQLLFHPRPKFIPAPAALVIDESFYAASLHGTEGTIWVDLAALLGDRTVPKQNSAYSLYATVDLRAVSRRVYDAITAYEDGWVPLEALIATGLTADDLRNAQKLEWRRKLDLPEVLPGMPQREALAACKRIATHNQRVARLARLWRLLALQLEAGHERSPWLQFQYDAPLRDDEIGPGVRMTWRSDVHISWRGPTLLLDATLQPEIARAFFPLMEEPTRVDAPTPHTKVRQITDRPMSHAMLIPTQGADEKHNKARRNNLERLRRLIEVRAADVAPARGVVICQQNVEKALKDGPLPENIEVTHFSSIRGLNAWSEVALLMVVGRTEPSPRAVELIARALFGVDVEEIPADADGNIRYQTVTRGIRMRDGTGRWVEGSQHPDPWVEAIRHAICEAELVQAIGRGRGVNRTADNPLQIDILTNVCLPGIEVDQVMTWDKIQPSAVEVMRARGAVPVNYADMAAAHPDLFPSAEAARKALERENPGQTSIREFLIDVCPGFPGVSYRRRGTRGPAGRLLYYPARIDPQAWLTERLGDVIVQPAAGGAEARAAPVARRCEWFIPDGPAKLHHCGVEIDPSMRWCPEHIQHSAAITGYGRRVSGAAILFFSDEAAQAGELMPVG